MIRNVTVTWQNATIWSLDKHSTNPHDAFFYIEYVCNAWFTIEICVRSEIFLKLHCIVLYLQIRMIKGDIFCTLILEILYSIALIELMIRV